MSEQCYNETDPCHIRVDRGEAHMTSSAPSQQQEATSLLDKALAAAKAGRRAQARTLLAHFVEEDSEQAQAWLALAELATEPRQAKAYARHVLRLDPHSVQAVRILRQVEAQQQTGTLPPPHARSRVLPWGVGICLLVAVLFVGATGWAIQTWTTLGVAEVSAALPPPVSPTPAPTATPTATPTPTIPERVSEGLPDLYQAWEARDWAGAIRVLHGISALDATYPGLVDAQCDTYLHWARDLVAEAQVERAYEIYRSAYQVCNEEKGSTNERQLALLYLAGQWRYDQQQWEGAAQALQQVYDANPDYAETATLLYTSYISATQQLISDHRLYNAREMAEAAQSLEPEDEQAQELLRQIETQLAPTPTPVPSQAAGQLIEINISEQRMYVWENGQLLYKWLCSTGLPGRDTAPGRFSVLDKIPEAWAGTWALRMPYWMGIYWAGTLENGIHALPINSNGVTLWGGLLGGRASFGCIILSTENARTLYNWAHVGTPVWIHY
jgi:lipoprotein-anchoring transpeptidase ErfK/SrfK